MEATISRRATMEFVEFIADPVLKTCKGRDKLCSLLQNFAKWNSLVAHTEGTEGWQAWRNVENSMSDGRKIFRFIKYIPESVKSYHAFKRAARSSPASPHAIQDFTEGCARGLSCLYMWYDNLLWAQAVGMIAVASLKDVKRKKNQASLVRLLVALLGEAIFFFSGPLRRAMDSQASAAPEDPAVHRLDQAQHLLVLVSILCNIRMTLPRVFRTGFKCGLPAIGVLGMASSLSVLGSMWVAKLKTQQLKTRHRPL
eukprot:TRINITY_DN16229_c0_g1_i1.p1 TRINITY_DN16229_c0_g1~~TRINITY_DN16229_c0_g1_i1.p1  ORF type:complete len:255 (+),score=49.64 TRINITY_DN16229_c0_g1_i1:29-793(+)